MGTSCAELELVGGERYDCLRGTEFPLAFALGCEGVFNIILLQYTNASCRRFSQFYRFTPQTLPCALCSFPIMLATFQLSRTCRLGIIFV